MRVATFSIAGERRVGIVDLDAQTIAPFDFAVDQAKAGILALIERNGAGCRAPCHPSRCAGGNRGADPAAAPQHLLRRQELSRARARVCPQRLRFQRRRRRDPKTPIIFSKVPESVVANHASVLIDSSVSTAIDYEAELAVIIGKGGRGISKENALDHVGATRSSTTSQPATCKANTASG